MKRFDLKKAASRGAELLLVLFLGIGMFILFLGLLQWIFPIGTSLKDLLGGGGREARAPREEQEESEAGKQKAEAFFATLSRKENIVKSRLGSSIVWTDAAPGMTLHDRDAVQTMQKASAQISFDRSNAIKMGGNSLVVLKRLEQNRETREKKSVVVVLQGELRGNLATAKGGKFSMEMTTPSAVTKVRSADGRSLSPSDFRVIINPDKSSTIAVFRGSAQVSARGKTVTVGANQISTVKPSMVPEDPKTLAPPPLLSSPAQGAQVKAREVPAPVTFSWGELSGVEGYRLMVARDKGFQDLVVDERVSRPTHTAAALRGGSYYWRVAGVSGWNEGRASEGRQFRVVSQRTSPLLDVAFPSGAITDAEYQLRGKSEPGVRVYVNGAPATLDGDGAFSHRLSLGQGITAVTVEAVDEAGNISYRSARITCRK